MIDKLFRLVGWRRYMLAAFLGVIAALGFPPIGFILGPFIAFPLLLAWLWHLQNSLWHKHFFITLFFGLGYFTFSLYWITFSLGIDLQVFWWLIPFSLFGIPLVLSFYISVALVLLKWSSTQGVSRCFAFAFLWSLAEFAWGHGPLAFPWNPLGTIFYNIDPILQNISIIGINGLTIFAALLVSIPSLFIGRKIKIFDKLFAVLCVVVFVLGVGYGTMRPGMSPLAESENLPTLRLVQPKIPLLQNWTGDLMRKYFLETLALSEENHHEKPDIIIWPESPLPVLLAEDFQARQHIASNLKKDGYFIGGALHRSYTKTGKLKIWNSLIVLNHEGEVTSIYDKYNLVPFGEFVPFRSILPSGLTKITVGDLDFSRGEGPRTLTIPPFPPFSPLICFEAIFSGDVLKKGAPRPQWMLNITNDAWFGHTSGPYQHLQLVRMRSIEEGVPLVRAANTGISVIFDAYGNEVKRLGLGKKGVLDAKLPPALKELTIFAKYGSLIYIGLMFFVLFMALIIRSPLKK